MVTQHSTKTDDFFQPYIGSVPVDLYRLFFEVQDRNGFSKMSQQQWVDVAAALHLPTEGAPLEDLKKICNSYLAPYEPHYRAKLQARRKVRTPPDRRSFQPSLAR